MNGASQRPNGVPASLSGTTTRPGPMAAVADARERFAAGADSVDGVRPEVLLSWYRCREHYHVDPQLARAPSATEAHRHSLATDVVLAELGGHAATAARDMGNLNGLVAVTDPEGRIVASWGDRRIQGIAADQNLTPWANWSEVTTGTNGMGSALHSHGPVLVRGPEHWCEGFHGWECAGMAVRDVVTDQPLAVLDMSCWQSGLPDSVLGWLRATAAATEAKLHQRAHRHGTLLTDAFTEAHVPAGTPLAVVDIAGKVVLSNDEAATYLGTPRGMLPAQAPTRRWTSRLPALPHVIRKATERAGADHHWTGSSDLGVVPSMDASVSIGMQPVFAASQLIGMLIAFSRGDTKPALAATTTTDFTAHHDHPDVWPRPPTPSRIVACHDERWILLDPREIRFAQADHNNVWLATDYGQLLAACRGLDQLEHQLVDKGFLRTHRSYLANLARIREVQPGIKGTLVLASDARRHETIPVARRHAAQIRHIFGL